MIDLHGHHVLITGASSGLGRACAVMASKMGATIFAMGRDTTRLAGTMAELAPGAHRSCAVDITDYAALEGVVSDTVAANGHFSGLIHSAGIQKTIPLKSMTVDLMKEVFSVNVYAGIEIARLMTKRKNASPDGMSIIFLGSVMSSLGDSSLTGYCASKAALLGAVKALSIELAPRRIRVNCLSPGFVQTDMMDEALKQLPPGAIQSFVDRHPLGPGKPEDIANAAAFLLARESRWITGTNFLVDGGYSAF